MKLRQASHLLEGFVRGYLIYRREEAVRNEAFIRLFYEEGKVLGISFQYVPYEEYRVRELPDFVLNRTRDAAVSHWYEGKKVLVLHSSFLTEIGNHKMKTLQYLQKMLPACVKEQKWAPASFLLSREKVLEWLEAAKRKEYEMFSEAHAFWETDGSCILKSVDGHGGSEVTELFAPYGKTEDKRQEAWEQLYQTISLFRGKECMLQEKIASDSRDVRIYILGGQIYRAMARQGKKDFRSNFSLGGLAACYELSEQEKRYVQKFLKAFQRETLGLIGLDFIIDRNGTLIFNELEEMVGTRMLYQNTDCNIVRDYVKWILCYYSRLF